jgi:hypothetical protein
VASKGEGKTAFLIFTSGKQNANTKLRHVDMFMLPRLIKLLPLYTTNSQSRKHLVTMAAAGKTPHDELLVRPETAGVPEGAGGDERGK